MDEIAAVVEAWNDLHRPAADSPAQQVEPEAFFGSDGEWL